MEKLVDSPISEKNLQKYTDLIFSSLKKNSSVTLITFKGSGKTAELKYLTHNFSKLSTYDKSHIFAFIDLETSLGSWEYTFKECLNYMSTRHKTQLNSLISDEIKELLYSKEVTVGMIINIFSMLTLDHN